VRFNFFKANTFWTGEWSPSSDLWNQATRSNLQEALRKYTQEPLSSNVKSSANHEVQRSLNEKLHKTYASLQTGSEESGTFWMKYADFVRHFGDVYVCKARCDWLVYKFDGVFAPSGAITTPTFKLKIERSTHLNIGLFYDSECAPDDVDYEDLCLVLLRAIPNAEKNQKYVYVGSSPRRLDKLVNYEAELLEPGTYVIMPFSLNAWSRPPHSQKKNNKLRFNLVVHSLNPVILNQEPALMADLFLGIFLMCTSKSFYPVQEIDLERGISCYVTSPTLDDGMIVVVENTSRQIDYYVGFVLNGEVDVKPVECLKRRLLFVYTPEHSHTESEADEILQSIRLVSKSEAEPFLQQRMSIHEGLYEAIDSPSDKKKSPNSVNIFVQD
jgi:hypothetical protein